MTSPENSRPTSGASTVKSDLMAQCGMSDHNICRHHRTLCDDGGTAFQKSGGATFFEKAALRYAHSLSAAGGQLARSLREKYFSDVHAAGRMILFYFAAAAAKLCEAFFDSLKQTTKLKLCGLFFIKEK